MRPMKPDSQGGRLTRALVRAWPAWAWGPEAFGNDFYTARNRFGDTLAPRGLKVEGRERFQPPGRKRSQVFEWRFASEVIYHEACLLVRSWDTGEDLDELRERDDFLRRAIARAAEQISDTQESLAL